MGNVKGKRDLGVGHPRGHITIARNGARMGKNAMYASDGGCPPKESEVGLRAVSTVPLPSDQYSFSKPRSHTPALP